LDSIFLRNLVLNAHVGVTQKERKRKQAIVVDLRLFRDLSLAGKNDDPESTTSYSDIRASVSDFISKNDFKLLEGLAEGVASLLLKDPFATKVRVSVRKKKYSVMPSIGVEITRSRNG
jgi:FolB domain-containing protein